MRQAIWALVLAMVGWSVGCGRGEAPSADGADADAGPRRVKLALNWKPEPQFGGFYAAQIGGVFARHGLDVEILPGGSGTPVVQMIAAGQVPYGIASGDEIVIARSKGQDVVALFAVYQTCPQGILVRADRQDARTLADVFARGTVAMQRGLPYALHLERTIGFGSVRIVPYQGGVGGLLHDGDSFAQQCFVTSEPILLRRQGVEPRTFLVAEAGYNPYTTVLIARGDHVKAHEREAAAMVAAVREGWQAYLDDPGPTNAHMLSLNPAMDPATMAESAELQKPLIQDEVTERHGLGTMTLQRWRTLTEQLAAMGLLDREVDPAAIVVDLHSKAPRPGGD